MVYPQRRRPGNWNDQAFGDWFPRLLVFLQVPSLHTQYNHKVVLEYSPSPEDLPANFKNRFEFFQPGLKRILNYGCVSERCRIGARTLGSCAHTASAALLLGNYNRQPDNFQTKYKRLHMFDPPNAKSLNVALCHP